MYIAKTNMRIEANQNYNQDRYDTNLTKACANMGVTGIDKSKYILFISCIIIYLCLS